MISLLDTEQYVTNACSLLERAPGYRIIPISISCALNGSEIVTSIVNFLVIFLSIFILTDFFTSCKKLRFSISALFAFNSLFSFSFFYPAAHSYAYTLFFAVLSLKLFIFDNQFRKSFIVLLYPVTLLAVSLVRSECLLYLVILYISISMFQFLNFKEGFIEFIKTRKKNIYRIFIFCILSVLTNFFLRYFFQLSTSPTNNLGDSQYLLAYPNSSYPALAIWSSILYLKGLVFPHTLSFFGNYFDWDTIDRSFFLQTILYLFLISITITSTYGFIKKKKSTPWIILYTIAVFIIPTFLISHFLRNQWYFPARGMLGSFAGIPFIIALIHNFSEKKYFTYFFLLLFFYQILTFSLHTFSHYKNVDLFFSYESKFLNNFHPIGYKNKAISLASGKKYDEALHVLRKAYGKFPPDSVNRSDNTMMHFAYNVYVAAIISYSAKKFDIEKKALSILTDSNVNGFIFGLACLQDDSKSLNDCSKYKSSLCSLANLQHHPIRFYKKPKAQLAELCFGKEFLRHIPAR